MSRFSSFRGCGPAIGRILIVLVGLARSVSELNAADTLPTAEAAVATVSRQAKTFVERCRFVTTGPSPAEFSRHPEAILRWSNPTAGAVYGDIYLYTQQGRPAAVVSYYRWFTPDWGSTIEVCALHPAPFVGSVDGTRFWKPETSALKLAPLEGAEVPAASAAARLIQLRRLADSFHAQLTDTRANDAGVQRTLRRLPQPVYRYPNPSAEAAYLDGAVFAFVEGTDPELLLLVEAVPSSTTPVWQYGIARMNRDAIQMQRDETVIWKAGYLPDPNEQSRAPYSTFSADRPLKPVP